MSYREPAEVEKDEKPPKDTVLGGVMAGALFSWGTAFLGMAIAGYHFLDGDRPAIFPLVMLSGLLVISSFVIVLGWVRGVQW